MFPSKVLLATDDSPESAQAARMAVELPSKTGSELHGVTCTSLDEASNCLRESSSALFFATAAWVTSSPNRFGSGVPEAILRTTLLPLVHVFERRLLQLVGS